MTGNSPFLSRGGGDDDNVGSTFSFRISTGNPFSDSGFRISLIVE